jgi:DNA-binding GntR family transcriptional regulator
MDAATSLVSRRAIADRNKADRGESAKTSPDRVVDAIIRSMGEAHERLLAFRDDGGTAAFLDERRRFYDTIIQIGGNLELKRMLPLMQIHLLRMQFQAYITPRDREKQFKEYETITETILSGDAMRAQKVAGLHIRRTRLSLMRLPDEAFPAIRTSE